MRKRICTNAMLKRPEIATMSTREEDPTMSTTEEDLVLAGKNNLKRIRSQYLKLQDL